MAQSDLPGDTAMAGTSRACSVFFSPGALLARLPALLAAAVTGDSSLLTGKGEWFAELNLQLLAGKRGHTDTGR